MRWKRLIGIGYRFSHSRKENEGEKESKGERIGKETGKRERRGRKLDDRKVKEKIEADI